MPGPGRLGRMGGPPAHRPPMHPQPIIHRPRPVMYMPRYHSRYFSYLGTGLSALVGSAIGTTIANNVSNKKAENTTNTNYNKNTYEVFSYCPNCGTQRIGNNTVCGNCGASLIK